MGVKEVRKELPGGDVNVCTCVGFSKLEIPRSRSVDIDTDTLVFLCALRHKDVFNAGNCVPTDGEF